MELLSNALNYTSNCSPYTVYTKDMSHLLFTYYYLAKAVLGYMLYGFQYSQKSHNSCWGIVQPYIILSDFESGLIAAIRQQFSNAKNVVACNQ